MLRIWAVFTAICSYIMLILGAIVSKTGSGEGCGNSWPFCHGQLIPISLPIETIIEYSHRIVSGTVGFFILILTFWAWLSYRNDKKVKVLAGMSLFFVLLQGALGALTVVFQGALAKKAALSLHFGFSLISFASVVLLTIYLIKLKRSTVAPAVSFSSSLKYTIWGLTAYTYLVVYSGALVRHTGATMGCGKSFPLCGTTIVPNLYSLAGFHMLHRYFAVSLVFAVIFFFLFVRKRYKSNLSFIHSIKLATILILLQAISGVITVFTGGQLMAALVHTTLISLFFTVLCYLCIQVGTPWDKTVRREENVYA